MKQTIQFNNKGKYFSQFIKRQFTYMEENNDEKKEVTILKQEDISQIIKHFSFIIQQRFQQIQKNYNYFACLNSIIYDRSEIEKIILRKYNDYKTSDQHEIKLLQKFVERLLQIFQFFRLKTDQPQILQQMSQKITQKLNQIIQKQNNHLFLSNRPKTHTLNVKPSENRSQSNDFLSIVGPECQRSKFNFIQNATDNNRLNTQTESKKIIEVGKLFKYVFSILKRGYLVRLRMQRPQKKYKVFNKENITKGDQSSLVISVEGTCALLRNNSTKGNKQTIENQMGKVLSFCRDKPPVDALKVLNQNKPQFQISQKIKNRSITTNQYSFLSSQNHSTLKQSTSKIRQLDRKLNLIYGILNIQKCNIVRVAKEPQVSKKDQIKRNYFIENESKKYLLEYRKWRQSDRRDSKWEQRKKKVENQLNEDQARPLQIQVQRNQMKRLQIETQQGGLKNQKQSIRQSAKQNSILPTHSPIIMPDIVTGLQNQIQIKTQPILIDDNHNSSHQTSQPSNQIIHVSSSKPYSKFINNFKTDQIFNENVLGEQQINVINSRPCTDSSVKSKSVSNPQKRILRLDLPTMYADNFNWTNQSKIFFQNHTKKTTKLSEESQYYLQNYHHDSDDDGVFVPLLPRKHQNNQNFIQTKNGMLTSNKKSIIPNCHPLNRCRLFREKKLVRNSIMVPLMEFNEDLKLMKEKQKNRIN